MQLERRRIRRTRHQGQEWMTNKEEEEKGGNTRFVIIVVIVIEVDS